MNLSTDLNKFKVMLVELLKSGERARKISYEYNIKRSFDLFSFRRNLINERNGFEEYLKKICDNNKLGISIANNE